ncbi:hypothetical protein GWI33_021844 [Rhynchophorus ferrugineus]|uniref:Uncharacterized protein n=1 Tax=Rhynchophorus ferrugineus TaxID=354439 RepID=A0A834ITC3_RHYFE|nr:hypothetical protein GWI33_021844 [Rhynchophorus ferrugineus]
MRSPTFPESSLSRNRIPTGSSKIETSDCFSPESKGINYEEDKKRRGNTPDRQIAGSVSAVPVFPHRYERRSAERPSRDQFPCRGLRDELRDASLSGAHKRWRRTSNYAG